MATLAASSTARYICYQSGSVEFAILVPKAEKSVVSRTVERRQVFYAGQVQGVGFRYTAQTIARGYAVTGYVCNLADGRVELVAEGSVDQLDAFLQELGEQKAGQIRSARCDRRPATGEFASFAIRY